MNWILKSRNENLNLKFEFDVGCWKLYMCSGMKLWAGSSWYNIRNTIIIIMITWKCRNMINLGRSFSTSGLRMITNSSQTGVQHDRTKAYDHRIFLTILQPRSIPKVVFVPITTRFYERLVHLGKTLFFF